MIAQEKFRYLVLLGGNTGHVEAAMANALEFLRTHHIGIVAQSALYETPPWGFSSEHDFLNRAVILETQVSPTVLLDLVLQAESLAGRGKRVEGVYTDRPLDIDILLWGTEMYENERLTIPHPRMHLRRFVLVPACEIAAHWEHPMMGISLAELLENCPDMSEIKTREAR